MTKDELLNELSAKILSGEISPGEVAARMNIKTAELAAPSKEESRFPVTKMLYALGGVIVLVGVSLFVSQVWYAIGPAGHIIVTLGFGLLITALGSVLLMQGAGEGIGGVFHFIGGMLLPGGALVTLYEMHIDFGTLWPVIITFAALSAFYFLLNTVHKHPVITFFTISNATVFIYLLAEEITPGAIWQHDHMFAYLTMAVGLSYILLGYSFRSGWNAILVGALYFFGSSFFFTGAFYEMLNSEAWQLLYFALVFGGLFLSVFLRSRMILVVSTLYLIAHLSYITGKYFADSLGWPISLVILGFIFIALGYFSISINKKYIKGVAAVS